MTERSVALVVLDTLRKDRFDEYFDWLPGRRFENAYTTANWTAPAHASLFTGQYGTEVGVTAKSRTLACGQPVLPEQLRAAGYETIGLSANPNVSSSNRFDRGFDEFVNPTYLKNPGRDDLVDWEQFVSKTDSTGPRLYLEGLWETLRGEYAAVPSLRYGLGIFLGSDQLRKTVPDDGATTVRERVTEMRPDGDTFLFVNLMEAHTPYDPPEPYNTLGEPVQVTLQDTFTGVDDPDRVRTGYDDAARYLADIYEEIFAQLEEKFDYVVTLSDHGEMLGEEGLWNHTYGLYKPVTHVPLVVSGPGLSGDCSRPVSLLDVHRTILEIAGVDAESRGHDLREETERRDYLSQYRGLIEVAIDRLREVGVSDEEIESYDEPFDALVGGEGEYAIDTPDELRTDGVSAAEARRRLTEIRDTIVPLEPGEDDEELDDDVMSQLEDLGYA